ncbi:MAG: hypothetical protein NTV94_06395 [Planctomycetota bacterium]|nr:hypothetical protein [Planctomycetota bacterium]
MSITLWVLCILWLSRPGAAAAPAQASALPAAVPPSAPVKVEVATELSFQDMFVTPIGPRGATYAPRLLELAGKRVRLKGYMVRRATYTPGRCVLTQVPMQLNEREMGMADDLPVTATWVDMPGGRGGLAHAGGLIEVTGLLSLGPRKETDGRVSHVRIVAESLTSGVENPKVGQAKP